VRAGTGVLTQPQPSPGLAVGVRDHHHLTQRSGIAFSRELPVAGAHPEEHRCSDDGLAGGVDEPNFQGLNQLGTDLAALTFASYHFQTPSDGGLEGHR